MNQQPHTPDILECLANLSNDEVFTSVNIANRMLNTLPTHLWSNPHTKFLDPFTKSGVFLREIAKRLMKGLATAIPDEQARRNHILGQQLYGIAITRFIAVKTPPSSNTVLPIFLPSKAIPTAISISSPVSTHFTKANAPIAEPPKKSLVPSSAPPSNNTPIYLYITKTHIKKCNSM